ncbi:MAG: terminase large subunit [bacterium]
MGLEWTAEQYVDDVLSGRQPACKWVRLACERHRYDRNHEREKGLRFDEKAAKLAIAFFAVLHHWKGEWAGQPIVLQPWQQFIVWSLFGWKRADGLRRFRTAYVEVARKNGKTTLAAGLGLYLMIADGEPGAEVYSAATKKDQAKISHRDATEMVKSSPHLRRRIGIVRDNLHSEENKSKFEPLGRDADSTDGLNPHGVIADELHAWKDGSMWGVLETATGARRQPMMIAITTAGFDPDCYCMEQHNYVEQVLEGTVEDDTYFGIIYTLDKEDQEIDEGAPAAEQRYWEKEELWIKANPNLGVSKKLDTMRAKARRATEIASNWSQFLTKELNIWTRGEKKWLNVAQWQKCGFYVVDASKLHGRRCYGGLDLSSTTDLTALVWVFPPESEGEPYEILCRFWVPEESLHERVRRDRVPYDRWEHDGYLIATPGNIVDYNSVITQIEADRKLFDVQELAYDRWGSAKVIGDLQDIGFTVDEKEAERYGYPLLVQFGQGYASMSGPSKELEKLVLSQGLAHGNHPVLTWNAHNVVVTIDPAENIKPDKSKSRERIDGIVATIMGLARAIVHRGQGKSVYEERGIRSL